ncbi:MAG: hypothetical protein JW866_01005 [Ignavibacteriales bacterium]|nr:hypothetical protein [Ignavibacteriales bacterium]
MKSKILIFFLFANFLVFAQTAAQDTLVIFNSSNSCLPTNTITDVYFDKNDNIWIATYDKGVIKISEDSYQFFDKDNSQMTRNYVYRIEEDNKANIWMSSMGSGMIKYSNDSLFVYYKENSEIGADYIYNFDIDKNNNLWIGTWENGLVRYDGKNFTARNMEVRLTPHKVMAVLCDDDTIWYGDIYGLLSLSNNNFKRYDEKNSNLPSLPIYMLKKTLNGVYWLGYKQHGVARRENNKWEYLLESQHISVNDMDFDSDGNLWLASFGTGLVKYDNKTWTYYNKGNKKFPDDLLFSIHIDENNNKWVGSYFAGLIIFNEEGVELDNNKIKLLTEIECQQK